MRATATFLGVFVLFTLSCSGGGGAAGPAAPAPSPDAGVFGAHGLSVSRPDGWVFVAPDASLGPDAVVVLQGPIGDATLAPVVEIDRRALSAADRRRNPTHILTQIVLEISQTFDGFDAQGGPEETEVAGVPASRLVMRFSEGLPEGGSVERVGTFYGLVHGGHIWIVRCLGPADGSAQAGFDAIVRSLELEQS